MSSTFRQRILCPHCEKMISGEDSFGAWSREKAGKDLSVPDIDYIVHRFKADVGDRLGTRDVALLMIVETKICSANMDDAQRDTMFIVDKMLRTHPRHRQRSGGQFASNHTERPYVFKTPINGKNTTIFCYGVHKVRMSGPRPDDSAWRTWDDKEVTEEQLIQLLRFDLHPDTLKPLEIRRRKPAVEKSPMLPGI